MTAAAGPSKGGVIVSKTCARCGAPFEAKSPRATFCKDACRKAASRAGGRTVPNADVPDARPGADTDADGGADIRRAVVDSTFRELADAKRLDSALGAAALLAAARLASSAPAETGSAFAALIREHRAALAAALVDADGAAVDPVDDLRGAVLKMIRGGAA